MDVAKEELKPFPITANREGTGEVRVSFPGGSVLLCAHGARALAHEIEQAAVGQYCDGYRHGDESTMYIGFKAES